jgi:hypothetical protein
VSDVSVLRKPVTCTGHSHAAGQPSPGSPCVAAMTRSEGRNKTVTGHAADTHEQPDSCQEPLVSTSILPNPPAES